MKKLAFAAFAALGIIVSSIALLSPANAVPATYNQQSSMPGGEG